MRRTYANPLEYSDFDEFPFQAEEEEEEERVPFASLPEVTQRVIKRRQQEWRRIFESVMSPAAREKAIARMGNTRHDFNLIVWSGARTGGSNSRNFDRLFADSMKPRAINLLIDGQQLRDLAGGAISPQGELRRSARESIYTAHTLLHRIGDDHQPTFSNNRKWHGWDLAINEETLRPFYGKNYRAVVREMVRRAAGIYLADPRGQGMFVGRGPRRNPSADEAVLGAAKAISYPVALLAFDPAVAGHAVSTLDGVPPRFGEEAAALKEERRDAAKYNVRTPAFDPVREMRAAVTRTFSHLLKALWYGAGTTWMSRADVASDYSQIIADTFPQTEIYGGVKLAIGRDFGRLAPKKVTRPGVELPPELVEEVNAALVPVARALDTYNNLILDSLVGRLVSL